LQLEESRLPILLPLRDSARHLQEKHNVASTATAMSNNQPGLSGIVIGLAGLH
jgi:hypothetical protein